jgi:ornithine--oxo-acid transaminase
VKKVPANQAEIIVARGNFHGRTTTIISFSSEESYKENFGPFTPGFCDVAYGDIKSLREAITPNTAAFLVEPIQGEGGVIIPPPGYLAKAKELCTENNVLFIADEIQTGLGRTGKLFACDHENVRPDIVIIGKALGGGFYPISAILADQPILGLFRPGQHGSTFGGNPLAAAVARAALKVLTEEELIQNSAAMGEYFMERLAEIPNSVVKEVRGRGLLIGVELKHDAGGARRYCEGLMHEGILCKETHHHIIRFAPPLVIQREQVDWAIPKIQKVLNMK